MRLKYGLDYTPDGRRYIANCQWSPKNPNSALCCTVLCPLHTGTVWIRNISLIHVLKVWSCSSIQKLLNHEGSTSLTDESIVELITGPESIKPNKYQQ